MTVWDQTSSGSMRTKGWWDKTKGDKILQEFEKKRQEGNKPQKAETIVKVSSVVNRYYMSCL